MSKISNLIVNLEEREIDSETYFEKLKKKEIKPFDFIVEADNMIFNSITKL